MKVRTTKIHWAFLGLAIGDLAFAYVTPATYFRLAPFFRIALFANASSDVRRELYLLVQLLPGLSSVVLLVVCWVAFFAFFALVLFNGIPGSEHYFGTFGRSMWQLWVLATTSNWPDVRSPKSPHPLPRVADGNLTSQCSFQVLPFQSLKLADCAGYGGCVQQEPLFMVLLLHLHYHRDMVPYESLHRCCDGQVRESGAHV